MAYTTQQAIGFIKEESPQIILSVNKIVNKNVFGLIAEFASNENRSWFIIDKISSQAIKTIRFGVSGMCDFEREQEHLLKALRVADNEGVGKKVKPNQQSRF